MDARFVPFKRTLLGQASLKYDRDQQSKDANIKIDAALKSFFHLMIPHFRTGAATAVLEYMVRKYKCVPLCNPEPLLQLAPRARTSLRSDAVAGTRPARST